MIDGQLYQEINRRPVVIIHDLDKPLRVPRDVAVCPYCKSTLVITGIDEWSTDPDGGKVVEEFGDGLECSDKPENFGRVYDVWLNRHSDMPYVNWLPVGNKVTAWAQENVRFVSGEEERQKLRKWIEATA